jgi:hypothetical protein
MTTKKNTEKLPAQSTPEASDEQIAARIRALAANPATPAHVQKRMSRLAEVMAVEGLDSVLEDTPVMLAEQYRQAAPHATTAKAKKAKAELVALVERYATEEDADLAAFAHHFSEVLRIAKTADFITTRFYRDLTSAWNECINELKCFSDASLQESEEYIRLAFKMEAGREGGPR